MQQFNKEQNFQLKDRQIVQQTTETLSTGYVNFSPYIYMAAIPAKIPEINKKSNYTQWWHKSWIQRAINQTTKTIHDSI